MSMMASLAKGDTLIRLEERRKALLFAMTDVGNYIRQIQGGVPNYDDIEGFLTKSAGLIGSGKKDDADMQDLTERLARLEKRMKTGSPSDKTDNATIEKMINEAVGKLTPKIVEAPKVDEAHARAVKDETTKAIEDLAEVEARKIQVAAKRAIEDIEAAERRVDLMGTLAEVKAKTRDIVEEIVDEASQRLKGLVPIAEVDADVLVESEEGQVSLLDRLAVLEQRQELVELRLEEMKSRKVTSTFTSSHAQFGAVKDSVRRWMAEMDAPQKPVDVLKHISDAGFEVDINHKDIGNRLSAMGFIRVVSVGGKVGKLSKWWTPALPVPDGFELR